MTEMAEKTVQTTGQTAEVETTENAKCKEILYSWMCCKSYNGEEIDIPEKPIGTNVAETSELPGYLNRMDFKAGKNGSFSDGTSSDSGCSLNRKNGSIGGKSISSEEINSECDSGLGSASDSGRKSKEQSDNDASEKSDGENKDDLKDEGITLDQIKANFGRKPKRTESTLSRFSSIFSNDGRKLTDVLVEEFRLNDRFSGLSMDRIWGGFMDGIREERGEVNKGKSGLETIEEDMNPESRAKRALTEKKNRRRRRRPRKEANNASDTSSTSISGSNKEASASWQQDLPVDWQDVITI